jgi:hypothetical protein
MRPLDRVLGKLEHVKRSGKGHAARCPAHEDREASLSIRDGDDGRVLLKCFAGCSTEAIVGALGLEMRDLFPPRPRSLERSSAQTSSRRSADAGPPPTVEDLAAHKAIPADFLRSLGLEDARYGVRVPYRLADGSLGRPRLRTARVAKKGSKWIASGEDAARPIVPYGLDRLEAARKAGYLAIVEGESDCWTLWLHEEPALGIPGVELVGKLEAEHVAGIPTVYVMREPDQAGASFPGKVAARLRSLGFAGEVLSLVLPVKDPADLHKRDPKRFRDEWRAALGNAAPVAVPEDAGEAVAPDDGRPRIVVREELHAVSVEALDALVSAGVPLYQRGGVLVRVTRDPLDDGRGIVRSDGAPTIQTAPSAYLRDLLDTAARWVKLHRRSGETVEAHALPPAWVGETLLARGEWPFPYLAGIVAAPTLRPDGSLLDRPGYDAAARLLYLPDREYPPVPARPSLQDARRALEELLDPIADFPFVAECDIAAAFACLLTMVARHAIRGPVPMFVCSATTRGSGKTLLMDALATLGTGRSAAKMPPSSEEEETRKRVLTVTMAGDPAILLDNVEGTLGSAALAGILTAWPTWRDRVLGESRAVEVPARAVWLATGNNLGFRGDLGRRVVPIDLDPRAEHPEDRCGPREGETWRHEDLRAHVERERPRLLVAALTVLRAYVLAGRPRHGGRPYGSYEAWDGLIRGALVWAGAADPNLGRERLREDADLDAATLREALAAWHERYADVPQVLADVARDATSSAEPGSRLAAALAELAPPRRGGTLDARGLGYALRRYRGRVAGGLRFTQAGEAHAGARLWRVVEA